MKNLRKATLVAGVSLALTFGITACGGGDNNSSPSDTKGNTATTEQNENNQNENENNQNQNNQQNDNNQNQTPSEGKAECLKYNPVKSACDFIP